MELPRTLAGLTDRLTPPYTAITGGARSPYRTKALRVHEPRVGRHVYLMVTRFDGSRSILGDIGYRSDYFQFDVMSLSKQFRTGNTAAYSLLDDLPDWFQDTHAFALITGLESGSVDWDDLSDGDKLTGAAVSALTLDVEWPPACAYCGGGPDAYDHLDPEERDSQGEWYIRDDAQPAHQGCSPRA